MTKKVEKTVVMPKKIAKAWLAALRSGKYKQGQNRLHDKRSGGMCCLGVLEHVCEGMVERGQLPTQKFFKRNNIKSFSKLYKNDILLSKNILASDYNDSGHSFKQIAKMLEPRIQYLEDVE